MKKICFLVLVVAFLAGCRSVPAPRVSILGDSYSTFQGWIPEGNAVWYPYAERSVNDVTEASECWWSQVIEALGGQRVYLMGKPEYYRHLYVWSGVWR